MGPEVHGVAPGADVTYCTYLDYYADRDYEIVASSGHQSSLGGHHMVAFGVANPREPGTGPCTDADMVNGTTFLGGGNATAAPLTVPDGVAFRFLKGTQVMFQHHWINATAKPIDGATAVDLTIGDGSRPLQPAGMFLSSNTVFQLAPNDRTTAVADCTVQESLNVFMIAGHEHALGKQVVIERIVQDGTKTQLYDSGDWRPEFEFDPPRQNFTADAPLILMPGDRLVTTCTWNNTTAETLTFPKEMCFAVSHYYPSTGSIMCMDGTWSHSAAASL
jgi:hypothetical protein